MPEQKIPARFFKPTWHPVGAIITITSPLMALLCDFSYINLKRILSQKKIWCQYVKSKIAEMKALVRPPRKLQILMLYTKSRMNCGG
jgi:hypothetical protein